MSGTIQVPSLLPLSQRELAQMAEHFYGYGRWDAPYWFIGLEPGGTQDGDTLEKRYQSWKKLGLEPVVDCAKHHLGFGFTKWHQHHPPTEATWRQLIRLLLSHKGEPCDLEAIRAYQRDKWGTSNGETCVIELSGLATSNMKTPQDRKSFVSQRIQRIQVEAVAHSPKFIVMYGVGRRDAWERITGARFDSNGLCHVGKTVVALAIHPTAHGSTNDYWVNLGRLLRNDCGSERLPNTASRIVKHLWIIFALLPVVAGLLWAIVAANK